ncbi:crossover junction endodeoxyribonuclease RuvC [Kaarinaea lacus]
MIRILGIDPGSRFTGFGVIESDGKNYQYITSGFIRVTGDTWADRLKVIFESVNELVETHQPHEMSVEKVFMHRNADSALKLGQARGAAICAVVTNDIPVHEYTPAEIKQSVVGKGNAAKEQVQHMVRVLLNLPGNPQADAADALAAALCHSNTRDLRNQLTESSDAQNPVTHKNT